MTAGSSLTPVTWVVVLAGALATAALGAESAESAIPPHPLVIATESVCRQSLPQACDEMAKLTLSSSGLTADDSIRLLWVGVLRSLDGGDEISARKGLSQILGLDRLAQPPSPAPARLGKLLKEARALLPSTSPRGDRRSRLESDRKAAGEREPEPKALLRAAQALYDILEMEGAAAVIDMARSSSPLTATEHARVFAWLGTLKMELETGDEVHARTLFREALEADCSVRLPGNVPPRTLRVFQEVKATIAPQPPPAVEPIRLVRNTPPPAVSMLTPPEKETMPPPVGLRTWGLAAGGAGVVLAIGGTVAGTMALSAREAEKNAAASGDWDAYVQYRDAARTAALATNGFFGAGAVALGAGAILLLNAPGELKVGAGVGPGKVSLAIGGCF